MVFVYCGYKQCSCCFGQAVWPSSPHWGLEQFDGTGDKGVPQSVGSALWKVQPAAEQASLAAGDSVRTLTGNPSIQALSYPLYAHWCHRGLLVLQLAWGERRKYTLDRSAAHRRAQSGNGMMKLEKGMTGANAAVIAQRWVTGWESRSVGQLRGQQCSKSISQLPS